ncbi:HAD superfamily hydrolase (TIGR01490 family) [Roseimicrobium gellanilyticum]|uniref:HAD superfamily hydrolase (TIGR01490 family) n=1 Tax=Roseimicrobium gellanilyticum TaxID=748857 RepID=A0A366HLX3_9BACT|nr:HAD-IB family hydrolase [Roseimicrobium gellanilyticum]RBP43874.1 HAD superfamily hydrolase (TIGR01490 family) [Roseimicrobium gellanilyticum]
MPSFAFFDLDHTLLPFDTQTLFANFVLRRERWRTGLLAGIVPVAVMRAVGLAKTVTTKRAFMSLYAGMKRETLHAYAKEFAETDVKRWVYPELLEIMAEHRRAGRTLILNTASPDYYAPLIGQALGFDHSIATKVIIPEKVNVMPQVVGLNNKREAKLVHMKQAVPAVAAATKEELEDSWSYSDSSADLPLLKFAGNAMLIHPSPALEAIGREHRWQVLRPARPYAGRWGNWGSSLRQAVGVYPVGRPQPDHSVDA